MAALRGVIRLTYGEFHLAHLIAVGLLVCRLVPAFDEVTR